MIDLHAAVAMNDIEHAQLLLQNHANPNEMNSAGELPLWIAADKGYASMIELLLKNRAQVNVVCMTDNESPLFAAARNGHLECADLLLLNGANDTPNLAGHTALNIAKFNGHDDVAKLIFEFVPYAFGQEHFIKIMKLLEYKSNLGGICFGLTYMANQAMLSEDFETFQKRMVIIFSMSPEDLVASVEKNHQLPIELRDPILDSIHAFSQGVDLAHQPESYKDWFQTQATYIFQGEKPVDIVLSDTLLKAGGFTTPLAFSGVYSVLELADHFRNIDVLINSQTKTNLTEFQKPIAFTLSSSGHSIHLGFNPKNNRWILCDANQMPCFKIADNFEQLARNISVALNGPGKENGPIIMSTKIHVKSADLPYFQPKLTEWRNQEAFIKTHDISQSSYKAVESSAFNATWLMSACSDGDIETVKKLLLHHANINQTKTSDGNSALIEAVCRGHIEIVKLLVENCVNVNLCDNNNKSPLFYAANNGHLQIVELLLKSGAIANLCANDNSSPLLMAAQNGYAHIVDLLIKHDADPDISLLDGRSPLRQSLYSGHADIAELLLHNGANPDLVDTNGNSPLSCVSETGNLSFVQLLLHHNAKPDLASHEGVTPLMRAVQGGHRNVVEALLKHGADSNLVHSSGITPVWLAAQNGNTEIVETLLKYGADINNSSSNAINVAQIAIRNQHQHVVDVLIHYADKADKNTFSRLLEYAIVHNHPAQVLTLLEKGADPKKLDQCEINPLFLAFSEYEKYGNLEIIKLLIAHGADLHETIDGLSILEIAEMASNGMQDGGVLVQYINEKLTDQATNLATSSQPIYTSTGLIMQSTNMTSYDPKVASNPEPEKSPTAISDLPGKEQSTVDQTNVPKRFDSPKGP